MKKCLIFTLCLTLFCFSTTATNINIISKPQSITIGIGEFKISKQVTLIANNEKAMTVATYFESLFENSTSLKFNSEISTPKDDAICFNLDNSFKSSSKEGYMLEVASSSVIVTASTETGLFYGAQSGHSQNYNCIYCQAITIIVYIYNTPILMS